MSKILIIPDIHHHKQLLKIWDRYEKQVDYVVLLGDFFDDFEIDTYDMQAYTDMYEAIKKRMNKKVKICAGNHEISYTWNRPVTGNNELYRDAIKCFSSTLYTESAPIVKIDNCIFSHAGITNTWIEQFYNKANLSDLDVFFSKIKDDFWFSRNKIDIFWNDESPLWSRPNFKPFYQDEPDMYSGNQYFKFENCWQFCGHTPTKEIIRDQDQRIVFLDVFSALHLQFDHKLKKYVPDEFGCQKTIIVDSETGNIIKEVK